MSVVMVGNCAAVRSAAWCSPRYVPPRQRPLLPVAPRCQRRIRRSACPWELGSRSRRHERYGDERIRIQLVESSGSSQRQVRRRHGRVDGAAGMLSARAPHSRSRAGAIQVAAASSAQTTAAARTLPEKIRVCRRKMRAIDQRPRPRRGTFACSSKARRAIHARNATLWQQVGEQIGVLAE